MVSILGSITELREKVAARRAWAEYNQTGTWLDSIYTTMQLQEKSKAYPDGRSQYLLDMLPSGYDVEGYAIFATDDMENDRLYAILLQRLTLSLLRTNNLHG